MARQAAHYVQGYLLAVYISGRRPLTRQSRSELICHPVPFDTSRPLSLLARIPIATDYYPAATFAPSHNPDPRNHIRRQVLKVFVGDKRELSRCLKGIKTTIPRLDKGKRRSLRRPNPTPLFPRHLLFVMKFSTSTLLATVLPLASQVVLAAPVVQPTVQKRVVTDGPHWVAYVS